MDVLTFTTKLSRNFLTLPKSAAAKLPLSGTVMIEGTINYLPFRAVLVPGGKGIYRLKVSKAMREAVRIAPEEAVRMEITRVGDEPETRVPVDLSKALAASPRSLRSWESITPMARRDWIFSICSTRQPETRKRRIDKAVDMLKTGHRRLCCFPGIKWMMKKNAKSCGMWGRLGR